MSVGHRYQHLVDACITAEQCAELAIILGSHALMLSVHADKNRPDPETKAGMLESLDAARHAVQELQQKVKQTPLK